MQMDILKKKVLINILLLTLQIKITVTEKIQWCFNGIKDKIKEISSGECYCEKGYTKLKFNSDDDLPLNKPLKFHLMTITIGSVFKEDGKFYPHVFLDDTLYELNV